MKMWKMLKKIFGWKKDSKMRIFIICSVRGASEEYKKELEAYVSKLEKEGHSVHLPHRDTKQDASGINICRQNKKEIKKADEVHLFYSKESEGTHFDMGMAFMACKKLIVVKNIEYGPGKSFARMAAEEWQQQGL